MASVELSLSQFSDFLSRKAEEVARLDYTPVLREIALLAKSDALLNFQNQAAPDGTPWAPLAPATRKRGRDRKAQKRGGRPMILVDFGILRASLSAGPGHVEHITSTSLEVGTAVAYGAYHQHGTSRMPARPFLGWSDRLTRQTEDAVGDFLEKKLGTV